MSVMRAISGGPRREEVSDQYKQKKVDKWENVNITRQRGVAADLRKRKDGGQGEQSWSLWLRRNLSLPQKPQGERGEGKRISGT